jgi:hypothetical protein
MLNDRYDELNSGHGEPVEGENTFARLKAKMKGHTDPTRLVFRRGLTPSQQPFVCLGFRSSGPVKLQTANLPGIV